MSLTVDGLIIKVNNVGEYDRIVSILTAQQGIIRAFVHGARSLKNKNAAATALLTYSHLTLNHKKDTYVVLESSAEKVFFGIRSDIVKLTLAQHFCEMAACLAPEESEAGEYLRLVLNSLTFLDEDKRPPLLLKSVTELRLLSISGYSPDLIACRECAVYEDETMYFDAVNGEIYCEKCHSDGKSFFPLGKGVLTAMRHIIFSEFSSIYNFTLPDKTLKTLSCVTENYLLCQIEHKFTSLEFFKTL